MHKITTIVELHFGVTSSTYAGFEYKKLEIHALELHYA